MAMKCVAKSSVASRPARASRSAVVVRASAESRRAVLSGFLAGAAAFTVSGAAQAAASPLDLYDDRKAKSTGFDIIYEARDLDLPQSTRDGFTQARASLDTTKARVKESEARIDSEIEPFIKRNYWVEAQNQLRRQVGTLRFDLNTLASTKPKEDKKKALQLRKDFITKVEALDLALRNKNEGKALSALEASKAALDNVLAAVL